MPSVAYSRPLHSAKKLAPTQSPTAWLWGTSILRRSKGTFLAVSGFLLCRRSRAASARGSQSAGLVRPEAEAGDQGLVVSAELLVVVGAKVEERHWGRSQRALVSARPVTAWTSEFRSS